jgi:hypothetical protein
MYVFQILSRCPVLAVMSWPSWPLCSVPGDLSKPTCLSCPVPVSCSALVVQSQLSDSGCPVPVFLWLCYHTRSVTSSLFYPNWTIPLVLSDCLVLTVRSWLSCPSCPTPALSSPAFLSLSCPGWPVQTEQSCPESMVMPSCCYSFHHSCSDIFNPFTFFQHFLFHTLLRFSSFLPNSISRYFQRIFYESKILYLGELNVRRKHTRVYRWKILAENLRGNNSCKSWIHFSKTQDLSLKKTPIFEMSLWQGRCQRWPSRRGRGGEEILHLWLGGWK